MALVIETGAGIDGADSFATVEDARTFALSRGVTLSATDSVVEVLLRKACDFIESVEARFKGDRVDAAQALSWPRSGVYLFESETEFSQTAIPALLVKAQCQLAMDAVTVDLLPNGTGREVIKQKIDVIETTFSERKAGTVSPELNKAMAILEPLFAKGGLQISTLRV